MKLSVVIVSYNVRYYLEQCLDSLFRALTGIDSEVFVVDNCSHDDSVNYLRGRFPSVRYVSNSQNVGFARANNLAIRQSSGEYVLLLNPDTIVGEDTIRESLAFLDTRPAAGALGVKMYNTDGTLAMESRRGIPSPMVAFYKMCGLGKRFPHSHRFGHYYMSYLSWDEPSRIEIISGAYCFLRRTALDKVGLLDEDFFMYGEDIDLSFRLVKGGFENWYLPRPILHYKGESTKKTSFRYVHVFYQAMLIFFRKHYGHLNIFLVLPIKAAIYGKALMTLLLTQLWRLRRALGIRLADQRPRYVFVGRRKMLDDCERIARENGLDASCHEVSDLSGRTAVFSDDELTADRRLTFLVYDTGSFHYAEILSHLALHASGQLRIGTYHPQTGIVITPYEIFR